MIWDYGDKIPSIDKIESTEKTFGLLTKFNSKEEVISTFKDYEIGYKTTYDLNAMQKNERDYKNRLKTDYYILIRK